MLGLALTFAILFCLAIAFAPEEPAVEPAAEPAAAEPAAAEAAPAEPAAAEPAPVEPAAVEPAAQETVPVVQDVTIEALRKSYTEKLDGLKGKVSPANIAKIGGLITEDVLNTVIFNKPIAAVIEGFLAVLSESKPIVAASGDVLPDVSKKSSDPVGEWIKETFPEPAAAG